jgi:hypothetical protein
MTINEIYMQIANHANKSIMENDDVMMWRNDGITDGLSSFSRNKKSTDRKSSTRLVVQSRFQEWQEW